MPTATQSQQENAFSIDVVRLRRKVAWRILPLVFLLYIAADLDHTNVGFAKLRMASDLHFSDAVCGLGLGIFFIGYLLLEVPGAWLVKRWSARKWFARILITSGLISALTGFVTTPMQFNVAQSFLGVAEAGFFPGIIVYFTHWFTSQDRTRALSGLVMAVPFSLELGAPVSALLLDVHWLRVAGWQWLFILEGVPAVILGFVTLRYMTDRPRQAAWLSQDERDYREGVLEAEAQAKEGSNSIRVWQALLMRNVWLLALSIFAANTGGCALAFWVPSMVKSLSGGTDHATLLHSGLFYASGLAGVIVFRTIRRPFKQPEVALRGWPDSHGFSPRRQWDHRKTVLGPDGVALPYGRRRIFLAVTLLGAAHAHAYRHGGGSLHRFYQYGR